LNFYINNLTIISLEVSSSNWKQLRIVSNEILGQFHQHFMHAFFCTKQIGQLFSNYSSAFWLFGKRTKAKKAHIKMLMKLTPCVNSPMFYARRSQKRKKTLITDDLTVLICVRKSWMLTCWWNRPLELKIWWLLSSGSFVVKYNDWDIIENYLNGI